MSELKWPTAKCRSPKCGAEIILAKTVKGATMPVNPDPHPDGTVKLERLGDGSVRATVLTAAQIAKSPSWGKLRKTHFETCPDAERFRSRGRRR